MATFALRRFSNAELLKSVEPAALMQLLLPYADYFKGRSVDFSSFAGSGLNYDAIAQVLASPDATTPSPLVDDLYFVDEMATKAGMDSLLEAIAARGIALQFGADATPADVAVQVRLVAPELLERTHAESAIMRKRRSYECFQARPGALWNCSPPQETQIRVFEAELGWRLEAMKRGRDCKLFVFHRPDSVWLLVRHGDPRRREGTIEHGVAGSVHYRPEKYDVIRYDPHLGKLAINADNKKIVAHYQELVGELLFGDRTRFPAPLKYTLEPLKKLGENSVACSDIDGIDSITLKEVKIYWGGTQAESTTHSAKDYFAVMKQRGIQFPEKAQIVKASFLIKFSNVKAPRTVTITHGNKATFTRDGDAPLVEEWLNRRGFLLREDDESPNSEVRPAIPASAVARA